MEDRSRLTAPLANRSRLERLLARENVDLLVASTPPNVTYLSDVWSLSQWSRRSSYAYAVCTPGEPVALVLPLGNADLLAAHRVAGAVTARTYGRFAVERGRELSEAAADERTFAAALAGELPRHRDSVEALIAAIEAAGGSKSRVAVERAGLPAGARECIAEALPGGKLIEAEDLIRRTRAVKTEREIDLLRTAAELTQAAANAAFELIEEGRSERELELVYRAEIVSAGALPIASSWTSGPRSALPNGQAGDRSLRHGEQLRFDGGCRFELYCADIARTAAIGEPSALLAERYAALNAGLEAAIAAAHPGASGGAVFDAAVSAVREAGMPEYQRSHCGHGIGIENYDEPLIASAVEQELEPGMVLCLETPFYELGWGGVQVEDTVLVTADGLERFTQAAPAP